MLFPDTQIFAKSLWLWVEVNLNKENMILYQYYTKNIRQLLLQCKHCTDILIMVYFENELDERVRKGFYWLGAFARIEPPSAWLLIRVAIYQSARSSNGLK